MRQALIRSRTRMPAGTRLLLSAVSLLILLASRPAPSAPQEQPVTWTDQVNTTVTGTMLQKTGGWDGVPDAGAVSTQHLTAGDGYVEFTVVEADTFLVAGLSRGNSGTGVEDIDFAFRFNGAGTADVLENGVYQPGGDTAYAAGDRFRVAVVNGRVQYSRNGKYLRESAKSPQYPLLLDTSLGTLGAAVSSGVVGMLPPPSAGGGFLEKAGSPALRARFTREQIAAFLPAGGATGPFRFPAPYNTDGVRLTNAGTCASAQDCVWYVGYSYWRNMNNHTGSADMYIFLGTDPGHGGAGPVLIRYNKVTNAVQQLGPLFAASSPYRASTGEGWYFSATLPTRLYTHLVGSPLLRRYDVVTRQFESGAALDLSRCPRPRTCPAAAVSITQPHSSDDDSVHSATVQDSSFRRIGCVVSRGGGSGRFSFYPPPAGFSLDECHVDKSGKWLMILETRASGSRRNRVVDLAKNRIVSIEDVDGALGHLDMGFGYAVGADTFNPLPNATILLEFPVASTKRPIGPVLHFNKRWDIAAANHIAHGNAQRTSPGPQYACGSNASRVSDMADEIVCFPLNANRNADGSLDVLVVAQVMTDLDATGGRDADGDDYEQTPKGNLDVTGRYFLWTTNFGGNRLDAVLVKIPAERLGASQ
jgi:hypothetical protein